MARKHELVLNEPTHQLVRVVVALPQPVAEALEQLRRSGLFGVTVDAVAERLICRALMEHHVPTPRLKMKGQDE